MPLTQAQQKAISQVTGGYQIESVTPMQALWAGQGQLFRLSLSSDTVQPNQLSLVVKSIDNRAEALHPRGWSGKASQQRKQRSYQVELNWYQHYAPCFSQEAPMAKLLYSESTEQGLLLALEDLAGPFPVRFTAGQADRPSHVQIRSCIDWLAQLHGQTLNASIDGLWPVGSYWHLQTRQEEWHTMAEGQLKHLAETIDKRLSLSRYQSIIHGDAKLANFCFNTQGDQAAAVDFQYVGKGVGVKDLMLLLTSVLPDEQLLEHGDQFKDYYFEALEKALKQWQPKVEVQQLIAEWQRLYSFAWADFQRFLQGWSPGHWKIGRYCKAQTELALQACHLHWPKR